MARYVPEKLSCANSQLFRKRSINPTDLGADGLRLEKTDSRLHLPKHFLEQLKLVREVSGTEFMPRITPNQATNRGVKTL